MATTDSSRTTWVLVVVLVLVLGAAVAAIAFTAGGTGFDYGAVEVSGEPLPQMPESASEVDPAVGMEAPEAFGASHDGETVEIAADGRPKVLVFLAHWCPHCQAEVPVVQDWIDANGVPEEVDLISVSTRFQPGREEWPPDEWLDSEGWTAPVLVDDEDDAVANTFGLGGTPYWVVIGADGKVLARRSGEIGTDGFAELLELARSSATTGTEDTGTSGVTTATPAPTTSAPATSALTPTTATG